VEGAAAAASDDAHVPHLPALPAPLQLLSSKMMAIPFHQHSQMMRAPAVVPGSAVAAVAAEACPWCQEVVSQAASRGTTLPLPAVSFAAPAANIPSWFPG